MYGFIIILKQKFSCNTFYFLPAAFAQQVLEVSKQQEITKQNEHIAKSKEFELQARQMEVQYIILFIILYTVSMFTILCLHSSSLTLSVYLMGIQHADWSLLFHEVK